MVAASNARLRRPGTQQALAGRLAGRGRGPREVPEGIQVSGGHQGPLPTSQATETLLARSSQRAHPLAPSPLRKGQFIYS